MQFIEFHKKKKVGMEILGLKYCINVLQIWATISSLFLSSDTISFIMEYWQKKQLYI